MEWLRVGLLVLVLAVTAGQALAVTTWLVEAPDSKDDGCIGIAEEAARQAGYPVTRVPFDRTADTLEHSQPGDVVILTDGTAWPTDAHAALVQHLSRGGRLLTLGAPAFDRVLARVDGAWVDHAGVMDRLAQRTGPSVLPSAWTADGWQRASDRMPAETAWTRGHGPDGVAALQVNVPVLAGWDTLTHPVAAGALSAERTVLTLAARANASVPELMVELVERDGSRWMKTLPVTDEWRRYAIADNEFTYWPDNPSKGRGGDGDHVQMAEVERVTVGLTRSLRGLGEAPYTYAVADLRAVEAMDSRWSFTQPRLESLSPRYRMYPTRVSRVVADGDVAAGRTAAHIALRRAPGIGSALRHTARQIVFARGYEGAQERGIVAHLYLADDGDWQGALWGGVHLPAEWMRAHADWTRALLSRMLAYMKRPGYLVNAGAEHLAYAEGETALLGAYATALPAGAVWRWQITDGAGQLMRQESAAVRKLGKFSERHTLGRVDLPAGEYRVRVELSVPGSNAPDVIEHPLRVTRYADPSPADTVQVRDGHFVLNGRRWVALGINYWPRYVSGSNMWTEWKHWLHPASYDPDIVEADLVAMRRLGVNVICVSYGQPEEARNLMDLLERCRQHGLKVYLTTPGTHPLAIDRDRIASLFPAARLRQSPAVFGYDLGWEVHVGDLNARKRFDADWRQWVADQYGSVDAAVADWGYDPRQDGVLTALTDEQLTQNGAWLRVTAAYRRFWDDRINAGYRTVRRLVKEQDPIHLMGARSGYGGTGALAVAHRLPFDLASGVRHIDFTGPEAYNIGYDAHGRVSYASFLQGGFNNAYARFVSANKPVWWPEYGCPIYFGLKAGDYTYAAVTAEALQRSSDYGNGLLRMVHETDADGSAAWWWPGGYRVDELSDFGMVEPDGQLRPFARSLTQWTRPGARPDVKQDGGVMLIDRDRHASGYAGVFTRFAAEWADAFLKGRVPELRTRATGHTSRTVPMLAVGGGRATGHNPHAFLNSEFVRVSTPETTLFESGTIRVTLGVPVQLIVELGNIGEPAWMAPKGNGQTGDVWLVARYADQERRWPLPHSVPYLGSVAIDGVELPALTSGPMQVTLRLEAHDRTAFGEVFRLTLQPE